MVQYCERKVMAGTWSPSRWPKVIGIFTAGLSWYSRHRKDAIVLYVVLPLEQRDRSAGKPWWVNILTSVKKTTKQTAQISDAETLIQTHTFTQKPGTIVAFYFLWWDWKSPKSTARNKFCLNWCSVLCKSTCTFLIFFACLSHLKVYQIIKPI